MESQFAVEMLKEVVNNVIYYRTLETRVLYEYSFDTADSETVLKSFNKACNLLKSLFWSNEYFYLIWNEFKGLDDHLKVSENWHERRTLKMTLRFFWRDKWPQEQRTEKVRKQAINCVNSWIQCLTLSAPPPQKSSTSVQTEKEVIYGKCMPMLPDSENPILWEEGGLVVRKGDFWGDYM